VVPHHLRLEIEAKGQLGFGRSVAWVDLAAQETGTRLSYRYQAQVGGTVAAVGNRLLGSVMKVLIRQFFKSFEGRLSPQRPSRWTRLWTRNRATLGGSVGHADPSAEIPLCLATLGGAVELRSRRNRRTVPASDFFQGILTTAREPQELVTGLVWPKRRERTGYAFDEIAQ